MKNAFTGVLFFMILFGCLSQGPKSSQLREFVRSQSERAISASFRLSRVPTEIQPQAALLPLNGINDQNIKNHLEFKFPPLSRQQFDGLMSTYSGWAGDARSRVQFEVGRQYILEDFLPLPMQAVVKKSFNEDSVPMPEGIHLPRDIRDPFNFSITTNCWATAYEIQRRDGKDFHVFYASPKQISQFLESDSFSFQVKQMSSIQVENESSIERNRSLLPGDVLLIYGPKTPTPIGVHDNALFKEELVHVATFIDDDIYFEKSAIVSESAFRIAHFNDLARKYSENGDHSKFRFIVRRFDKKRLPTPSTAFAIKTTMADFASRIGPDSFIDSHIIAVEEDSFGGFVSQVYGIRKFSFLFDGSTARADFESRAFVRESNM